MDADAGDLVRFAIAIENTGDADVFNLLVQDVIPPEYVIPGGGMNLEVRDGDGNAVPFTGIDTDLFAAGIELNDPASNMGAIAGADDAATAGDGSNIIIITYDLELDTSVNIDNIYTNTAEIAQFGAIDGGADHTDGSTVAAWTDDATIEVANVIPTKSLISTSETHTAGTNASIGEMVRYRLSVEVPEGTMNDFQLHDQLPNGLTFLDDGTAMVAFVSNGGGITSTDIAGSLNVGLGTTPAVSGASP